MKVLLVNLPFSRVLYNFSGSDPVFPLGLAYLASALRGSGHEVSVLDQPVARWGEAQIRGLLEQERFGLIGLSVTLFSLVDAMTFARLAKDVLPYAATVVGGPGVASFSPEQIFGRCQLAFDVLVHGEGEQVLTQIADRLEAGHGLEGIPGTAVFAAEGQVSATPPGEYLSLDELALPDRDILPPEPYGMHPPFGIHGRVHMVETARGCSHGCDFCCLAGELRQRSPALVVEELVLLKERFKIKEVHFVDPTFPLDRARTLEICQGMLDHGLDLKWSCKSRSDVVDADLLGQMAAAGCYLISYGLESGSDQILQGISKRATAAQNEQAVRLSREAGIRSLAYIMLGSPGETQQTVEETFAMVRRVKPEFVLFAELLPEPSSPVTRDAIAQGILTEEDVAAFYLEGEVGPLAHKTVTGLPRDQVEGWLARGYRDFYFRPGYMLERLAGLRSGRELAVMAGGVLSMLAEKLSSGPITRSRR